MSYQEAKRRYAKLGVDTDKAMAALAKVPVAIHLWQGNDVEMFDVKPGGVSGGIQATGNYPGRARNPQELMDDLAMVLSLCPGKKRLNLHMGHAVFGPGEWVDRDKTPVKAFKPWLAVGAAFFSLLSAEAGVWCYRPYEYAAMMLLAMARRRTPPLSR